VSTSQVLQAMCSDYSNIYGTKPMTVSSEHLAAAYYGWNFGGSDPAFTFQQCGCPAISPIPTPPSTSAPATSKAEVSSTWTTFFNGATPVAMKASLLQGDNDATADIRLFFAVFPATLTTKVDAIELYGASAAVTYPFQTGAGQPSAQPMSGTAVLVDGSGWSARRHGPSELASLIFTAVDDQTNLRLEGEGIAASSGRLANDAMKKVPGYGERRP
jgi:hypothetical protein